MPDRPELTEPMPQGAWKTVRRVLGVAVAALVLVAACETQDVVDAISRIPAPPSSPAPPVDTPSRTYGFKTSGDAEFDAWRTKFAGRADRAGRKPEVIMAVLDDLKPLDEALLPASFEQAEFVKPIWDYARSAVSPTRIANGLRKLEENGGTLTAIEAAYAPPREILGAIWGMESSYGSFMGNIDAAQALATQAAKGRRVEFNEGELLAMVQLIEDGAATRDQFRKASWAGALGQTQFMPSTFLRFARDFDRDGRKDLWGSVGDALASTANYLSASGWRKGEPWALETSIPAGFDYSLGDGRKLTIAEWRALGLAPTTVSSFGPDSLQGELFLPAGSYGPAFLIFQNFYVIKRYNNADSYALAIGLLADRLAGQPDLSRPWPTGLVLLTQDGARELQTALNKLGYNAGPVDGIIGRGTRGALQRFQKDRNLVADGFPTQEMLALVKAAAG
jgi:membrane-bound lytic murein transglycosylase B